MIFSAYGGGFGDCWATASFLLKKSEETNEPVSVWNIDPRIAEIAEHFDTTGSLEYIDTVATVLFCSPSQESNFEREYGYLPNTRLRWKLCFSLHYLRTKIKWRHSDSRRIVYQLTPRHPGPTSCRPGEIEQFVAKARLLEFEVVEMGQHMSLTENIVAAAGAAMFVGVDSGMSHLCHSVGTPIHLVRNGISEKHLTTTHAGNAFIPHTDIPSFLASFS